MRRTTIMPMALMLVAGSASASESVPLQVRGKTVVLEYYPPAQAARPKATVIIGSGDVGWVGLAVDVAEFLSREGYAVAGINVRGYLSTFTSGNSHVTVDQVPGDYM